MNGVFQFLLQDLFTRVPGQLQQEEACVGLWQEVVRGVVFIQNLGTEKRKLSGAGRYEAGVVLLCLEAMWFYVVASGQKGNPNRPQRCLGPFSMQLQTPPEALCPSDFVKSDWFLCF